MVPATTRKSIVFIVLGACLVALAVALHAGTRRSRRAAARRPLPGVRVDRAGADVRVSPVAVKPRVPTRRR